MPIVSCVVAAEPDKGFSVERALMEIPEAEVYGGELKKEENVYYIIVVLDAERYERLEEIESQIRRMDGVLNVAVAEAYFLDEFEKIESGELIPANPFHDLRKSEKTAEKMWFGEDEDGKEREDN